MNAQYICPVCGGVLAVCGSSLVCGEKHTFDFSKDGYVNLAVNKSDSGDDKMMCLARKEFLAAGYYKPFADAISQSILEHIPAADTVIDSGCGEGYYLRVLKSLAKKPMSLYGIDLAKNAIVYASRQEKSDLPERKIKYSVAGIFSLPFSDDFSDGILSVFAPISESENLRVLKKGGVMLTAGPGKRHLSGLKNAIYDSPYENPEKHREYSGFSLIDTVNVYYSSIVKKDDIPKLFTMTPYYWKTSKSDSEKLLALPELETELEFVICLYRKQ